MVTVLTKSSYGTVHFIDEEKLFRDYEPHYYPVWVAAYGHKGDSIFKLERPIYFPAHTHTQNTC